VDTFWYNGKANLTSYSVHVVDSNSADKIVKSLLMSGYFMGSWDAYEVKRLVKLRSVG